MFSVRRVVRIAVVVHAAVCGLALMLAALAVAVALVPLVRTGP